jgi:hypothetical protein
MALAGKVGLVVKVVVGFFVLTTVIGLLAAIFVKGESSKEGGAAAGVAATPAAASSASATASAPAAPVAPEAKNWKYSTSEDKMRNETTYFAHTTSLNSVSFDFPYNGGSSADLTVRQNQKYGLNIYLDISKGQFQCSYNGCRVSVKFDDSKVESYGASEPDSGGSTTLFLSNEKKFLESLRKAKKMTIEASFFQEGSRQFEFDVSNLEWPPKS